MNSWKLVQKHQPKKKVVLMDVLADRFGNGCAYMDKTLELMLKEANKLPTEKRTKYCKAISDIIDYLQEKMAEVKSLLPYENENRSYVS